MWTPDNLNTLSPNAPTAIFHHLPVAPAPPLDVVMLSGFFLSLLTLLIWMHPVESRLRTLVFAACLAGLAIYGFLQGAWPLGIVSIIWSAATLRRWHQQKKVFVGVTSARRGIIPSQARWEHKPPDGRVFEWN